MALTWEQVTVDTQNPGTLGRWWAEALGWEITAQDDEGVELRDPRGVGPTVLFLFAPEAKSVKNRLHFDFIPDDQDAEVVRLESLGAQQVDIGQGEQTWIIMADPEGNEFCILSAR